jgi:hypothetical protein
MVSQLAMRLEVGEIAATMQITNGSASRSRQPDLHGCTSADTDAEGRETKSCRDLDDLDLVPPEARIRYPPRSVPGANS